MASYHESVTPTATEAIHLRPYEYPVLPPIGRVLQAIREHCGVGGTIQPGVRQLASWANYASAGRISSLLEQLADDGWILWDGDNGQITLLADSQPIPQRDQDAITEGDQEAENDDSEAIPEGDQVIPLRDRNALIPQSDRGLRRPSPLLKAITQKDRSASRMEDHVLATADLESDSAAAINKLPCAANSITLPDRFASNPAALVLAQLDADEVIIADALAVRPDLTPEQVLASWAHFEPRIAAGLCTSGAFFNAIRKGRLHAAPRDEALDPAAYADDPQFLMAGQAAAPPAAAESFYDRAQRLLPPDLLGTEYRRGLDILMRALVAGASDDQALDALAAEQATRPRWRGAA